jgi:hypothetical protein
VVQSTFPALAVAKVKAKVKAGSVDPAEVGAVTIVYDPSNKKIEIKRPAYRNLTPYTALIDQSSIDITED